MSNLLEKLERVHALLINEEHEKADVLFHEAFVEAAKDIHNEIMEEEDWMAEEFDVEAADEDVARQENTIKAEADDEEAMEPEMDDAADEVEDEMMDDEGEEDFGGEEVADEASPQDALADIQAAIDVLQAEFDGMGDDEGEEDFGDEEGEDFGDDEVLDSDIEGEVEEESIDSLIDNKIATQLGEEEEDLEEGDVELEEAFDELDESFELESVTQGNTHAQIGTGGESFSSNEKSVGLQKNLGQREGGDAVDPRAKGKDHKGYDMETAPATAGMKNRKNVRGRSTDDQSSVSKEGDSSALINKDHSDGFGAENAKSPIGSKGSVQAKGLTEGKKVAKKATKKASK